MANEPLDVGSFGNSNQDRKGVYWHFDAFCKVVSFGILISYIKLLDRDA